MKNETVSTIIRFHDIKRLDLLERAVQSLHAQVGARVRPIVVAQRFSERDFGMVREAVDRQWYFSALPAPIVLNYEDKGQGDARSALLNLGIAEHLRSENRYLGFLDYDDLLYTHAYQTLVDTLRDSGAVVAFATIELAKAVALKDYEFIYSLTTPYRGKNKIDLLKENFCPLHSYLLDTSKVCATELYFRPELVRVEDYDFLLRVAGRHPCDFSSLGKKIGLYVMRNDGTNSTPTGRGAVSEREKGDEWKESLERLNHARSEYEVRFFASDFTGGN